MDYIDDPGYQNTIYNVSEILKTAYHHYKHESIKIALIKYMSAGDLLFDRLDLAASDLEKNDVQNRINNIYLIMQYILNKYPVIQQPLSVININRGDRIAGFYGIFGELKYNRAETIEIRDPYIWGDLSDDDTNNKVYDFIKLLLDYIVNDLKHRGIIIIYRPSGSKTRHYIAVDYYHAIKEYFENEYGDIANLSLKIMLDSQAHDRSITFGETAPCETFLFGRGIGRFEFYADGLFISLNKQYIASYRSS